MARTSDYVTLVLIPAGKTDWSGQDRIQGSADLPLSSEGTEQVKSWIKALSGLGIAAIYSAKSGPAAETAQLIAKAIRVKSRWKDELSEINLGLWQGMQISELRDKQRKVYKQWQDQPELIVPPSGESLSAGQDRLEHALAGLINNDQSSCLAVVLGELSLALARRVREGRQMREIWDLFGQQATWHRYSIKRSRAETAAEDKAGQGA